MVGDTVLGVVATRGVWRWVAIAVSIGFCAVGCATRDGPRIPIPEQSITSEVPEGRIRVVFFNNSNRFLYFESGPIRIQLNGQQVPSIWLDHFVQVFIEPGEYDLLLEHFDIITWKSRYKVKLEGPENFVELYNRPTSTRYRLVEALPQDFATRFRPGRSPATW